MTADRSKSQVTAALNHAAYTFRSFTAADWRAMAEECTRRADDWTCADCGDDLSPNAVRAPSDKSHRRVGDRWSCGTICTCGRHRLAGVHEEGARNGHAFEPIGASR